MPASAQQQQHAVERAGKIYEIVKQAAQTHAPCPTNKALADRLGCKTTAIVNAIAFLEANGMIAVERTRTRRTVTITATGWQTAKEAA